MNVNKETQWLCENSKNLERYAGQWVLFDPDQGIVGCAHSLNQALDQAANSKCHKKPYMFHVPTQDELVSPFPVVQNLH